MCCRKGCAAGWLLADGLWFGIQPISAGVFGVPAGFCGGSRGEPHHPPRARAHGRAPGVPGVPASLHNPAIKKAATGAALDDLHNPRASVVVRIGMGRKASFCSQ
jgi:hypothetical protein